MLSTFFFRQYRPEKCRFDILEQRDDFLGYKNKKFKKWKNWHPMGFTHGFGPKMAIFPTFFFLGNIRQKNVFYHILEWKNAFLGYKNKKFKKWKNWHFSKGVNPWFWSKNGHFSNFFFLGNIGQKNVVYDILERKDAFLGYKNKEFKKWKSWYFSKRVNPWFRSKNGHFWNVFLL